jgi:hypothetical protein
MRVDAKKALHEAMAFEEGIFFGGSSSAVRVNDRNGPSFSREEWFQSINARSPEQASGVQGRQWK